jgi:hypothetical protein
MNQELFRCSCILYALSEYKSLILNFRYSKSIVVKDFVFSLLCSGPNIQKMDLTGDEKKDCRTDSRHSVSF